MADPEGLHEIERIIAQRKMADAAKATAEAAATRETKELAAKVIGALAAAEGMLREEVSFANAAVQRGGRAEEFKYHVNSPPGPGKLLSANLTLSDELGGVLRDYMITVDAIDGKIVVRGHVVTLQQSLTNVLQLKREDWTQFLTSMYASNMR
jgi:hypothetical protein